MAERERNSALLAKNHFWKSKNNLAWTHCSRMTTHYPILLSEALDKEFRRSLFSICNLLQIPFSAFAPKSMSKTFALPNVILNKAHSYQNCLQFLIAMLSDFIGCGSSIHDSTGNALGSNTKRCCFELRHIQAQDLHLVPSHARAGIIVIDAIGKECCATKIHDRDVSAQV